MSIASSICAFLINFSVHQNALTKKEQVFTENFERLHASNNYSSLTLGEVNEEGGKRYHIWGGDFDATASKMFQALCNGDLTEIDCCRDPEGMEHKYAKSKGRTIGKRSRAVCSEVEWFLCGESIRECEDKFPRSVDKDYCADVHCNIIKYVYWNASCSCNSRILAYDISCCQFNCRLTVSPITSSTTSQITSPITSPTTITTMSQKSIKKEDKT